MNSDPLLALLAAVSIACLLIAILFSFFRQPYVIAYIIVGILLGPHGLSLINDKDVAAGLGSLGLVLLLFFVGLEVSLPRIISNWKVAIIGTAFQILVTVAIVALIGTKLNWPASHSLLVGFVISLSSTAIVIKLLQDWKELNTKFGQNALGILIVQDLVVAPMIIAISFLSGSRIGESSLSVQIAGAIAFTIFVIWLLRKGMIELPFSSSVKGDHELQVFSALAMCFGLALLAGAIGLSTALGAFIAGMIISSAKETHWVHEKMDDFRVLFVALFFVSVGILIDLSFIQKHLWIILLMVGVVFATKTVINAMILRVLGDNWKESIYAGALLSQIGEFSFILGAIGFSALLIDSFAYQYIIAVISLTLLLSPFWIYLIKRFTIRKENVQVY